MSLSCKRCGRGACNSHYRLRTDIPWCVMQSVGYVCEPSIMAGPIEALFWNVDSGVSKEPCIEWRVQIPHTEMATFEGHTGAGIHKVIRKLATRGDAALCYHYCSDL